MELKQVSHSKLETFRKCQFLFRLRYHEKIDSPLPKPDYFEFGHFIHRAFELAVKEKYSLPKSLVLAKEEFPKFGISYSNRIANMARNFISFQKDLYENNEIEKEETEEKFNIPLGYNGITFKGIIDRKIKFTNGKLLIVDYKTSKKHNQVSKSFINKDKQLLSYIWAISQINNIDINNISAMLFYLESGDKLVCKPDPRRVSMYINDVKLEAKEIECLDPKDAKATITRLCDYCDYRTICPHFIKSKSK